MNIRLAYFPLEEVMATALGERMAGATLPSMLVSYVYLEPFMKNRKAYKVRDWVLDSGAFSAYNTGMDVRLGDYIDCCKRLLDSDDQPSEIYALDVIGDATASMKNCVAMWKAGIEAIPCFHVGSPEKELAAMAKDFPKIALGGAALMRSLGLKLKWAEQCFARVWPKKIHGFAFSGERAVMRLPWHSVDASSWEAGPCMYGNWRMFGKMSVRGSKHNLQSQIDWYLQLERKARGRWSKEMALLDKIEGEAPTVHLAYSSNDAVLSTFKKRGEKEQ